MNHPAPVVTEGTAESRPHGTYARYYAGPDAAGNPGRCSCAECLAAVRAWQRRRARMQAYGRWQPYVDAAPVREHVRMLSAYGIGFRTAARVADVPYATITHLMYGCPKQGRPPTSRIRPETARRLLAVRPSPDHVAPGTRIDATGTHRRLRALVAADHALSVLAARLVMTPANLCTVLRSGRVTASTARAVAALYDELWDEAPDESTSRGARLAASARRMAAEHGWPPPAAWDDDTIDDPAAGPAEGWQRRGGDKHRDSAALVEDASELIEGTAEREGQGYTRATAAMRLGVSLAALEKAYERTGRLAAAAASEGESHAAA